MLIHVSLHPVALKGVVPTNYPATTGVPASLGRVTGYPLRGGQSAGTQAVIQPDSRWHCTPEVRSGSRSEELDLSISGPLLPSKASLEQTCRVVVFEPVAAIAAIRRTTVMECW